jgi:cysteine desulfurase/selenocysteine lyase
MPVDWPQIRSQFPALQHWTFLNTATFGQLPLRVKSGVDAHFARRDELACADFVEWFDDMDQLRVQLGVMLRCDPRGVAFIPNAGFALSTLLGRLDWRTGDQIVTLAHEFPNHYYYPAWLQRHGVELIETPFEYFYDTLTAKTRVVAVSTMNYSTGFRPPLLEMAVELRRRGILLYLDATQGIGALDYDLSSLQPDVFAANGYKWLLSPPGAAFMVITPELRERLDPLSIGWRSDAGWRSVESLNHEAPVFEPSGARYESGMLSFPSLYGMAEAVNMALEIGVPEIEQRVLQLAALAGELLRERGAEIAHAQTPIVCARFPDRDASEIAASLKDQRILVAARHGHLRVSPHYYNNEADLQTLAAAL